MLETVEEMTVMVWPLRSLISWGSLALNRYQVHMQLPLHTVMDALWAKYGVFSERERGLIWMEWSRKDLSEEV